MEKENLKILIVDDNEKDLKLLELKLIQLGFRNIIKARDGQEALKLALRHLPDLICLDLMMPGLDGGMVKEQITNINFGAYKKPRKIIKTFFKKKNF